MRWNCSFVIGGRAMCASCALPSNMASFLCKGERITARDLPPSVRGGASPTNDAPVFSKTDLTVKDAEKELIIRALKETGGNRTLAAKKIGMPRRTFHRKLHVYHLEGY